MRGEIKVDVSDLNRALVRLQADTKKDMGGIVRHVACLLAGNLQHITQPYGSKGDSKKEGEGAVMRDVGRVFMSAKQAYKKIQEQDKKLAKQWNFLIKNGKFAAAEKLIAKSTLPFRNAPIESALNPSLHQSNRRSRGRVYRQRPAAILTDAKEIEAYAKKAAKKVGFGKAGWVTAVSSIGGASMGRLGRIPSWVTRHKGKAPGSADDNSRQDSPSVTIRNQVSYASEINDRSGEHAKAARIMREKLIAYVEHVIAGNAKKAGFQARTTQKSESL